MCGCLEKMPVVARADCTEISALEIWKFDWVTTSTVNGDEPKLMASLDRAEIDFQQCQGAGQNNDLERFYERLYREDRVSYQDRQMVKRTLVGNDNCAAGRDFMMETKDHDVHYPPVDLQIDGSKTYNIFIEKGTNEGKDILFTSSTGDVALVNKDRIAETATQWTFTSTNNNGAHLSDALVNIRTASTTMPNKTYLGATYHGLVQMNASDSITGKEKWYLQAVPDKAHNTYYIKVSGGTSIRDVYLSTGHTGNPDLYDMDDGTGRQRWIIKPVTA